MPQSHTAIVTGANHGIGAATAAALAAAGCGVLCSYLRLRDAEDPGTPQAYRDNRAADAGGVVAQIVASGGRAVAVEADLTDAAAPAMLFDAAERDLGPVDILVNNATGWVQDTFGPAGTVLDADGVPVAELPRRSGVSKEGIAMAMGPVTKAGTVEQVAKPSGRGKLARLTAKGTVAQQEYARLTAEIEDGWRARYGADLVAPLRGLLEPLADVPGSGHGPLWRGLEPYPDGWRASVRAADTLPHYPMVLHRGGYPDGS